MHVESSKTNIHMYSTYNYTRSCTMYWYTIIPSLWVAFLCSSLDFLRESAVTLYSVRVNNSKVTGNKLRTTNHVYGDKKQHSFTWSGFLDTIIILYMHCMIKQMHDGWWIALEREAGGHDYHEQNVMWHKHKGLKSCDLHPHVHHHRNDPLEIPYMVKITI